MRWRVVFAALAIAVTAGAQEVHMADGEVLAGRVASVTGSRARLELADRTIRSVDVRALDHERLADGQRRWHAAAATQAPLAPPARAMLDRLGKGEPLPPPELLRLTDGCPTELVTALAALAASRSAAVRATALRALAMAATKESVRAALDAAIADASGASWGEVGPALTAGACLGAVQALDALADVERGLASKDKAVRAACAWIAVRLGSTTARPVLATFLADADHHVRESAAMCLAEAGDATGAKVLVAICKRESSPAMAANRTADPATRDLVARLSRRERVRACELLGELRHAAAAPVLRALATHKDGLIAAAAKRAVTAIEGK